MKALRVILVAGMLLFAGGLHAFAEQSYGLEKLVQTAEANSPDIHRLESALAADQAGLAGAKAQRLPTISFQNTDSYLANPQPPYVLDKGSLGSLPVGPGMSIPLPQSNVTVVPGQDNRSVNLMLSLDQPIYLWGKIREDIALREKLVATGNLAVKKQRDETRTMVTVNWYTLYYLDRIKGLLAQQQKVADELLSIAKKSLSAGQITEADFIEQRMKIQKITHAMVKVDGDRETALTNLRYLTGLTSLPSSSISFSGVDAGIAARTLPPKAALIAKAAKDNSDLKLLNLSQEISRKRVAIAKAGTPLKPTLGLNVRVGVTGSRVPGLQNDWQSYDNWFALVTLAINANLYDGGKAHSSVKEAEAKQQGAFYEAVAATRRVAKYITQTRSELGTIRENIAYYRERTKETEKIVSYEKRRLDTGAGSKLDYYQKRVEVFTEQTQMLEQELSYATRYFTLMNVIGSISGTR